MANTLKYRIVLRSRRGFAELRSAKTFEIWYGKRRIVEPRAFPASRRGVRVRRSFLISTITRIEKLRQIELRRRRTQYAIKKKKVLRKEIPKIVKELEQEQVQEVAEEHRRLTSDDKEALKGIVRLQDEQPDFKNSYAEEPQTLREATIEHVTITPIIPKNDDYSKRLIDKRITSGDKGTLDLTILDFSLKEPNWIPLDADTIEFAHDYAYKILFPHIIAFYDATKSSAEAYILRIKFVWDRQGQDQYTEQGISLKRHDISSRAQMIGLYTSTFRKFTGTYDPRARKKLLTKNYLEDQTLIFVTGFTLEASTFE